MLDKTNAMSANMIEEDADLLAREGLRTLVFLIKEMTKEEYQTWKQELVDIQCDVTKNEADEEVVITKLETDMIFLGVTGVEDLLQDGVRETIEDLFEGGIRVWVLTGDKKETAKCIAIKTGLTNDANNFFEIEKEYVKHNKALNQNIQVNFDDMIKSTKKKNRKRSSNFGDTDENFDKFQDNLLVSGNFKDKTLIVTGQELELIFSVQLQDTFIKLAILFKSTVICRCSPQQKADIVNQLRIKIKKTICAIGDGGNDVAMIQQANVGQGIEGKEGLQAALSADFSLKQFKDLKIQVFWHGRNAFLGISLLTNFIVHRGLIVSFIQVFFITTFYYVSISMYNGLLLAAYVCFFTVLPSFTLIFNVDVAKEDLQSFPRLYQISQSGKPLNLITFWQWFWISLYQAAVIYLTDVAIHGSNTLFNIVTVSFTSVMLCELLNIISNTNRNNVTLNVSIIFSIVAYFGCVYFLGDQMGMVMLDGMMCLEILIIVLIAWLPVQIIKMSQNHCCPSNEQKFAKNQKRAAKLQKKENGKMICIQEKVDISEGSILD